MRSGYLSKNQTLAEKYSPAEFEQVYPGAHPSSGFFIKKKPHSMHLEWALLLGFRSSNRSIALEKIFVFRNLASRLLKTRHLPQNPARGPLKEKILRKTPGGRVYGAGSGPISNCWPAMWLQSLPGYSEIRVGVPLKQVP
jgi:hypothetical protein